MAAPTKCPLACGRPRDFCDIWHQSGSMESPTRLTLVLSVNTRMLTMLEIWTCTPEGPSPAMSSFCMEVLPRAFMNERAAVHVDSTVAASTTEAEYITAAHATMEALWLRVLLTEYGNHVNTFMIMAVNRSALILLKNPLLSMRSKHFDVKYHFARASGACGTTRREVELH